MAKGSAKSSSTIQKAILSSRGSSGSSNLGGIKSRSTSITKPGGTSAVRHYAGFIATRERNPKLQRHKRYEEFGEMLLNQPVVAASVRLFLQIVKGIEWNVVPIEGDADSKRYAEDLEEVIDNLESGWPQIVQRLSAFVYWGFSISEWTAKQLESGIVGFSDIEPRSQHTIHRWEIQDTGKITAVTQLNPNTGEELLLERRRLIYAVDNSLNDDPEGLGLFRQLYSAYRRIENYKVIEEIGFDTDLRGVPIVKAPLEELNQMVEEEIITPERREEILSVYENFLKNHQRKKSQGMMIDSETYLDNDRNPSNIQKFEIELLRGDSSGIMTDLQNAINRERNNIAMIANTGFLLLGEDGAGSLALSETKMETIFMFVSSTLQDLAFILKRDMFRSVAKLNGWNEASLPDLDYEKPTVQDIIKITEALRNTSTAFGPLPSTSQTINEIFSIMGLEPIPEEEFDAQDDALLPGFDAGGTGDQLDMFNEPKEEPEDGDD